MSSQEDSSNSILSKAEEISVKLSTMETNTASLNYDEIQPKLDEISNSLDVAKLSWDSNTTMFTNSLDTVVEQASSLSHFDFKALSSIACQSVHEISSTVNKCILNPDVVDKVSSAISQNLSNNDDLPLNKCVSEISSKIDKLLDKRVRHEESLATEEKRSYSWVDVATSDRNHVVRGGNMTNSPSKPSTKSLSIGNNEKKTQDNVMDEKKTVTISNAFDPALNSSAKIKSVFNTHFKKMGITHCKRSMNGYILIEVDTVENAQEVVTKWDGKKFFVHNGPNAKDTSAIILEDARAKAVMEDVDKDILDEEITEQLRKDFKGASARRFINRNGPTFSVLVTFSSKAELERAQRDHVYVNNMHFHLRPYTSRPRIIQCFNCNRFGHIVGTCERAICCAVCSGPHKDTDCKIKKDNEADKYKCSNCGKNHTAFDRSCETFLKMSKSVKAQS